METQIITKILDFIPTAIAYVRQFLTDLITSIGLPATSFQIFALVLSALSAYLYLKQFVVSSVWLKISTILNYILLLIVFYLLLVKV